MFLSYYEQEISLTGFVALWGLTLIGSVVLWGLSLIGLLSLSRYFLLQRLRRRRFFANIFAKSKNSQNIGCLFLRIFVEFCFNKKKSRKSWDTVPCKGKRKIALNKYGGNQQPHSWIKKKTDFFKLLFTLTFLPKKNLYLNCIFVCIVHVKTPFHLSKIHYSEI